MKSMWILQHFPITGKPGPGGRDTPSWEPDAITKVHFNFWREKSEQFWICLGCFLRKYQQFLP